MNAKKQATRRETKGAKSAASTRARNVSSHATQRDAVSVSENKEREIAPPRWVLPLILFVFVALTSALIFRVPWGKAPDEAAHVLYVESLATTHHLPVFAAKSANAPGYEFHQPPLYYAVCALFWNATGAGVQNYLCRVVSMICGALTLIFLWRAARLLFPARPRVAVFATGFAALWPLHLSVSAAAGNDAMAGFICAAIFYQVANVFTSASTRARDFLVLGALCGLGILAKTTCLIVCFAALFAAWFAPQPRETKSGNEAIIEENVAPPLALLLTFGAMILVGGAWLLRNQLLYGDVLAQGVFNRAFSQSSPSPQMFLSQGVEVSTYLRALFAISFCTFWGIFGGPNKANQMLNPFGGGPKAEAFNAMPLALVCLLCSVLALWGFSRFAREAWKNHAMNVRRVLAWYFAGAIGVFLAFAQFNTHYFQAQARYFHPAFLPMALFFALGWLQLFAPPIETESEVSASPVLSIASMIFALCLLALSLWNIVAWRTLV